MPALPSGHVVTAAEYVGNGFYKNVTARCSAALSLSGTRQDVAGCTTTFTIVNGSAFAMCFATFDSSNTVTASNNVGVGSLMVDGVLNAQGEAHWDDRVSRITAYQSWTVSLAAGSHTIKLQSSGGGTMQVQTVHTKLTVIVFDLP